MDRRRRRAWQTTPTTGRGFGRRRGLAPVELVMAIPLVMFVTALSVIIGTATCWKLRTSVIARDAIWSHRWARYERSFTNDLDPVPEGWPEPKTSYAWNRTESLRELDHPAFHNRIIRGPLPNVRVNDELLDPTNTLRIGEAQITRTPAALAKLGDYQFDLEHPLLDGKWQYWELGIRGNRGRRFPVLYPRLPDANPALKSAYDQAYQRLVAFPLRPALFVLDRDDEFIAWYGPPAPDFHARLRSFCSLETDDVRNSNVERLIADIDGQPRVSNPFYDPPGVPRNMTERFLSMYRQQLRYYSSLMPPNQAKIIELEQKIAILEAFLATLN